MHRDELLAQLTAERYDHRWFKAPPRRAPVDPVEAGAYDDSEVTCARRRKELAEAWGEHTSKKARRGGVA
jgi:beta-xylosidase